MTTAAKKTSNYGSKKYWDTRYEQDTLYDWYVSYATCREAIRAGLGLPSTDADDASVSNGGSDGSATKRGSARVDGTAASSLSSFLPASARSPAFSSENSGVCAVAAAVEQKTSSDNPILKSLDAFHSILSKEGRSSSSLSSSSSVPSRSPSEIRTFVVGCGNSPMSADMHSDGFTSILSMDYSHIVISQMRRRYPHLDWQIMDCKDIPLPDACMDCIVDKGTLDALLCGDDSFASAHQMLSELHRVLAPEGVLFIITYGQPQNRLGLLESSTFQWSVEHAALTSDRYIYTMRRKPLSYDKNDGADGGEGVGIEIDCATTTAAATADGANGTDDTDDTDDADDDDVVMQQQQQLRIATLLVGPGSSASKTVSSFIPASPTKLLTAIERLQQQPRSTQRTTSSSSSLPS